MDEMDDAHRKDYARKNACDAAIAALREAAGHFRKGHATRLVIESTIDRLQGESAHIVAVWD